MHEFCDQHLHMRSARMKHYKVTEGEYNQKRLNMERSIRVDMKYTSHSGQLSLGSVLLEAVDEIPTY